MTNFEYIVQDNTGRVLNSDGEWWHAHLSHQYGWTIRRFKTRNGAQRSATHHSQYGRQCKIVPVVMDAD